MTWEHVCKRIEAPPLNIAHRDLFCMYRVVRKMLISKGES